MPHIVRRMTATGELLRNGSIAGVASSAKATVRCATVATRWQAAWLRSHINVANWINMHCMPRFMWFITFICGTLVWPLLANLAYMPSRWVRLLRIVCESIMLIISSLLANGATGSKSEIKICLLLHVWGK